MYNFEFFIYKWAWIYIDQVGPIYIYIYFVFTYIYFILAYIKPILALYIPILSPGWIILKPIWRLCWQYACPSIVRQPRCKFFRPGPLHGTKNYVKIMAFCSRQQKNEIDRDYEIPWYFYYNYIIYNAVVVWRWINNMDDQFI